MPRRIRGNEADGASQEAQDARSRRELIGGAGALAAAAALGGVGAAAAEGAAAARAKPRHPRTPKEALRALEKGNRRFQRGRLTLRDYTPDGTDPSESQKPFAAIVTCADSRLSPTLIFDVHHGNVFVSRIAGNSLDTGTLGSTEYAVAVLGVKLIMVLGHSNCGAIKAAISVVDGGASFPPDQFGKIGEFVDLLIPPIETIPAGRRTVKRCTRVNARAQAAAFAASEPIIAPAVRSGKVGIVAGVYDIASGRVTLV